MHTIIIANAPDFDASPFKKLLNEADLIIAADGGGNALYRIGVAPQIIIGDLDSLLDDALHWAVEHDAELQRYPAAKDETDLELALLRAAERGAERISVLGAFGGRWDQTLANVFLLALPELIGRDVRLVDVNQHAFLVRDRATLHGTVGDTVSLLPLSGAAHGITTSGLEYALHEATLHFERARGVSNVLTEPTASVSLREGLLLIVHEFEA